jgi:hypothetical protein
VTSAHQFESPEVSIKAIFNLCLHIPGTTRVHISIEGPNSPSALDLYEVEKYIDQIAEFASKVPANFWSDVGARVDLLQYDTDGGTVTEKIETAFKFAGLLIASGLAEVTGHDKQNVLMIKMTIDMPKGQIRTNSARANWHP